MTESIQSIRDRILNAMLGQVPAQGFNWDTVKAGAAAAGYQDTMPEAVFPGGLNDVVAHFSDVADRQMLARLKQLKSEDMRVRDRVNTALQVRFEELEPHKAIVKAALVYWSAPTRVLQGQRVLWRTADRIWEWAGDTATDYNRQTKRVLLCSILLSASIVWVDDQSHDHKITRQFIDRRIQNVMEIGKAMGKMRGVIETPLKQTRS